MQDVQAAPQKANFYEFTPEELQAFVQEQGKERFRAQQLYRWVYQQRVTDWSLMTNISKDFKAGMSDRMEFRLPKLITEAVSTDGTRKFLLEIDGGHRIEAVLIPSDDRLTLCVSSEVGCNMACTFCFTAKQKLKRRLTAGEIVGQFVVALNSLPEETRITNIVFMGMGEPLDNPDAVFKSIEILHSTWGLNVSKKRITVSTSGIVPMIPKVTDAGVRLAVSLNGSNNEVRSKVMPINKKWPIEELLEACREHARVSKDKVTLEYVLLKDVTDSVEDARELYFLTKDVPNKINIIPFNEHPNSGFQRPEEERVIKFQRELMKLGAHVLRRKTMGRDIYAACGQLTTKKDTVPTKKPEAVASQTASL